MQRQGYQHFTLLRHPDSVNPEDGGMKLGHEDIKHVYSAVDELFSVHVD